ncbi:uncharacterized protein LOC100608824 isoform X2 [Pan troglodytes]|uniref:uncharacterized protein LOC100608824 isoform X2 n=1 Tax=Pan troglodytes TaxID=9598 RepID=UPI0030134B19
MWSSFFIPSSGDKQCRPRPPAHGGVLQTAAAAAAAAEAWLPEELLAGLRKEGSPTYHDHPPAWRKLHASSMDQHGSQSPANAAAHHPCSAAQQPSSHCHIPFPGPPAPMPPRAHGPTHHSSCWPKDLLKLTPVDHPDCLRLQDALRISQDFFLASVWTLTPLDCSHSGLPRGSRAMKMKLVVLGLLAVVLVLVIVGLCLWLPLASKEPDNHVYARAVQLRMPSTVQRLGALERWCIHHGQASSSTTSSWTYASDAPGVPAPPPHLAIMNKLWLGFDLRAAIAAPILHVNSKGCVEYEPNFSQRSRSVAWPGVHGAITAHCSLNFQGSNDPLASVSQVAAITAGAQDEVVL